MIEIVSFDKNSSALSVLPFLTLSVDARNIADGTLAEGWSRKLIANGTNWTEGISSAAERLRDYGLIRIN